MKNIYIIFLLMAVSTSTLTAQNFKTKTADEFYERLQYNDAIDEYHRLVKRGDESTYVLERLANSYYNINDTKNAEIFYKRVVKRLDADPESVYNYAQVLKANGKFSEYNKYMKEYAKLRPQDSRAIAFMQDPNYLPRIADEKNQKFEAVNLEEINTRYSEFGGTVVDNELYFSSSRNILRKNYDLNDEPFLDLYKATIENDVVKNAKLLNDEINTRFHESSVAITPDGTRMYFDRNDYFNGKYKKSEQGINELNIFYAEKVNGEWGNIQSAPFNSKEFSSSHPAISPDGKTLYFSSDRPGGMGNADLYKVAINEDGTFGEPENLGEGINTEGREVFPFVDANGTLYFSSDAHLGLGGLDVFSAPAKGNGFGEVKNLGLGINSSSDDFAFSFNPETEEGYVSSNRAGGKGSDDIYKIKKIESCDLPINVLVVDASTNEPISDARIDLYDNRENKLKSQSTDADGISEVLVVCDQDHVVQAFKEGYESNAETVAGFNEGEENITIALRPIDDIVEGNIVKLNTIYFDFDRHNIKPQAAFELDKLVELMKKNENMVIKVEGHTDNRGSAAYNLNLSDRRAKSTVQYVISKGISKDRISGEGFGESRPAVDCGGNCTNDEHQQNRRSEFIIQKR
ncbi:OmpA family protein [Aequorivita sp. 609]|uniref:OmpA family protein n=1 Tax=Aequorivita TaxID=153265 RepID=UPI0016192D47|nr:MULTISPECIES: OmpA family protein [Aequorivita]MBB6681885.1 OmpA family protein [Aequorivita sp. 609]